MDKIEEIVANIKKDLPGRTLDEMNKYMFKNVLSKLKEMDIHYGRSKEDKKTMLISEYKLRILAVSGILYLVFVLYGVIFL